MVCGLVEILALDPMQIGDHRGRRPIDPPTTINVDPVLALQKFIQNSDTLGEAFPEMIGIEVPHRNSANLDARISIMSCQTIPVDSPVGEVLVRLDIQDGGNAQLPPQQVDVSWLYRARTNEQLGKDLVEVHHAVPSMVLLDLGLPAILRWLGLLMAIGN